MRRTVAFLVVSALSCGAPQPAPEPQPAKVSATQGTTPNARSSALVGAAPSASSEPDATWFADGPLTPLADELVQLAEAALAGRSLPPHRIEIETMDSEVPSLALPDDGGRPEVPLEHLVFAMEIDIIFDRPSADTGAIRVVLFLSRAGLKVVKLTTRGAMTTVDLPRWLTGVQDAGWVVVQAARAGRLESLLVGEPERAILADDPFFELIRRDGPEPQELIEISKLIPPEGPSGFRVDDMVLIVRDRKRDIWGLEFDMDRERGRYVLDSRPFLRVSRLQR